MRSGFFQSNNEGGSCQCCGLFKGIKTPKMPMPPEAKGKAGVFAVGQSPGREEDKVGRQFIGESGQLLRETTRKVGFDFDEDFWVQNAFRCHPKVKKQSWQAEVKHCNPLLMQDIRSKKPWLVVALGKEAIQATLREFGALSVGKYQSLLIPMVENDYWVYCTNHPAALLHGGRGQSKYEWVFEDDWKEIRQLYEDRKEGRVKDAKELKEEWELDNYEIITDFDKALRELERLYHHDFYRDYENYPLKPYNNDSEVICFSIAYQIRGGIKVFCIPWRGKHWTSSQRRHLLSQWKRSLENPNTTKMAHHHKHELQWDDFLGIDTKGQLECTAIRQHLLREKGGTAGLKFQVFARWGCKYGKEMGKFKEDMRKASEPDIYKYCCHDSRFGLKLWLEQEGEKYDKFNANYKLMMDGDRTLTRMEITGATVDLGLAKEIGDGFGGDSQDLEKWLLDHDWVKGWKKERGYEINLNSGQQVGDLLFDILKLRGGVRLKTQWSTGKEDLAGLSREYEWIRKWQQAGRLGRFKGTFVDGHIFSNVYDDGRLHGSFSLTIPETYRSSMDRPNLQNIVKRDARGKELRKVFIPIRPGWLMGFFDYEQHEVVTYCHNSRDKVMIGMVLSGYDFHKEYAARLLRKNESKVSEKERDMAGKQGFIFPILYGAYPKIIFEGLQKEGYAVSYNHVTRVWQEFRRQFSRTIDWQEEVLAFYRKHGYVESKLGFRRRAPLTANEIINFPTQSMAFHYLLYGLHKADEKMLILGMEARPVKQVHDEAEFHFPKREQEQVFEIAKESFEELPWAWTKNPPVRIGGKIGLNWYDLEEVSL